MSHKYYIKLLVFLSVAILGFLCGYYLYEPSSYKRYKNFVHPYYAYSKATAFGGDTASYNKVVRIRREKTPSHPDYFDLSISMAAKFGYTPGYYNAYLALHDLYKYNNFKMGANVKRLMYSYLQLAIEHNDKRVTEADLKSFHAAFPNGKSIIEDKE